MGSHQGLEEDPEDQQRFGHRIVGGLEESRASCGEQKGEQASPGRKGAASQEKEEREGEQGHHSGTVSSQQHDPSQVGGPGVVAGEQDHSLGQEAVEIEREPVVGEEVRVHLVGDVQFGHR